MLDRAVRYGRTKCDKVEFMMCELRAKQLSIPITTGTFTWNVDLPETWIMRVLAITTTPSCVEAVQTIPH